MRKSQRQSPKADAKRDCPTEENQVEQYGRQRERDLRREVSTSFDVKPKTANPALMKVKRPRDDEAEPYRRRGEPIPNSHA